MVTGGWITQADRSRWQQKAAAELAAILKANPDLPVIAWTVAASGGALSGQVLAPAAGKRGLFGEWRQALGLDDVTEPRPGAGRLFTCTPAASAAASRSASSRPSSTTRRTAGERPGCRGCRAAPGSGWAAGKADSRGAPGVPGRDTDLRPARPGVRRAAVRGARLRAPRPQQEHVLGTPPALAAGRQAGPGRVHGVHQPGVVRAPAAAGLRDPRLQLLPVRARSVPDAPPAMVPRRVP